MRVRQIKPGFFANELLAEINPLGRLLFIGLWNLADREGRLEDRPRKIKAKILPYDDTDVDDLLNQLANRGFILRYETGGERYIQIINFAKHQNPHPNEAKSIIPAPLTTMEERTEYHGDTSVPPNDEARTTMQVTTHAFPSFTSCTSYTSLKDLSSETDVSTETKNELQTTENLDVKAFHDYYCEIWKDVFPRGPKLTEGRIRKIKARLKRFTLDELKQACDNLHASPWHRGENPNKVPYGDIDFLVANDEKVDEWLNKPMNRASPVNVSSLRKRFDENDLALLDKGG